MRRKYGTGSITRRPDGSYQGQVNFGRLPDGRRYRKTFRGKTEAEVERAIGAALAERDGGTWSGASRRLLTGDYLDQWLEAAPPHLRPRTLAGYRSIVEHHLIPGIGHISLKRLGRLQVQQLLTRLATGDPPAAPNTVRNVRTVLHRALRDAIREGLRPDNPAHDVDLPAARPHSVRALSVADARAILDAMRGHRLEPLVTLALATGLRQGEALALRWPDVDLEASELRVRHTLHRHGGQVILSEPKTRSGRRTVPLPGFAVAALKRQRDWFQAQDRRFAGERWREAGWIFTTAVGTPMHGPDVTRRLRARLEAAGLAPMRFHDLRHGAATLMLAAGAPAREIMETLGHSTITITMDLYTHVLPASQRETARRLDVALGEV